MCIIHRRSSAVLNIKANAGGRTPLKVGIWEGTDYKFSAMLLGDWPHLKRCITPHWAISYSLAAWHRVTATLGFKEEHPNPAATGDRPFAKDTPAPLVRR